MSNRIFIHTFGGFYITDGTSVFSNGPIRKSKMWDVMKYLIAYRGKPVPAGKLIDLLWSYEEGGDPSKSLRDIIYRLRKTLASYGGEQQYIVFAYDSYYWNTDVECYIDAEEFETALENARNAENNEEKRMEFYIKAFELYKGGFLSDAAPELRLTSLENYYKRLYLKTVFDLAEIYENRLLHEDAILLYDKAIEVEPHEETLYIRQINLLMNNGEYVQAKRQYKLIERILEREFGAKPSSELTRLMSRVEKTSSNEAGDLNNIKEHLEQVAVRDRAFFCGPETFRHFYSFDRRTDDRTLQPIVLGLITVSVYPGQGEEELLSAMKTLRAVAQRTLRCGDVVSQYSKSQFVFMLAAGTIENARAALTRVKRLFENEFGENRVILDLQFSLTGRNEAGIDIQTTAPTY